MTGDYRYATKVRADAVADIAAAASDKPGHAAYVEALVAYWTGAAPGDDKGEPIPEDLGIKGVSWPVQVALSSDFSALYQPPRPGGTYGGEYRREYIRLRGQARTAAMRAARERRLNREAQESAAASTLGELLDLGPDENEGEA